MRTFFIIFLVVCSSFIGARHATGTYPSNGNWFQSMFTEADVGLHFGLLYGKSFEYVFDDNQQISRLEWPLSGVVMVGGTAHLTVCNRFHLDGSIWDVIHATQVISNDQDFLGSTYSLSASPTSIDKANTFDISGSYDFYIWHGCLPQKIAVRGIIGFLYNEWAWTARGGVFGSTDPLIPGQGLISPNDLNATVITYKQLLRIPYLGLGTYCGFCDDFGLDLEGRYTPLAYATARDDHALRDLVFIDTFTTAQFWAIGAKLHRTICGCVDLSVSYFYENFTKSRGDTQMTNKVTGITSNFRNSAGLQHSSNLVEIGLAYCF